MSDFSEDFRKILHGILNLVSYPAVNPQNLILIRHLSRQRRWILETYMDDPALREIRAVFMGRIANGDDVIKADSGQIIDRLRKMTRQIDPHLAHDFHRSGIHAMFLCPSRIDFILSSPVVSEETFGHLGSAGIPCAEEEDRLHKVSIPNLPRSEKGVNLCQEPRVINRLLNDAVSSKGHRILRGNL